MDKARNFHKNTFHHLYNRGANKQNIFLDDNDYLFFIRRLKHYKTKYNISILSYCLMKNHFHLFVKQNFHELSISKFISDVLNSYTKSINKKYSRSGTLFESKTKSKQIEDENYFVWVIKYILENPIKAGIKSKIYDWHYSNAKDLLGFRKGTLCDNEEVFSYFQSEEQMKDFLLDKDINVDYRF